MTVRPGTRFSKVPITFRARKAICETANRLFWKAGLLTCSKSNRQKNYREVWRVLKSSPFLRFKENCDTRIWPVTFRDFRETGPWSGNWVWVLLSVFDWSSSCSKTGSAELAKSSLNFIKWRTFLFHWVDLICNTLRENKISSLRTWGTTKESPQSRSNSAKVLVSCPTDLHVELDCLYVVFWWARFVPNRDHCSFREFDSQSKRWSRWNQSKVSLQNTCELLLSLSCYIRLFLKAWSRAFTDQCKTFCIPLFLQVIVERYHKEKDLPLLDKTKFLVPQELTMSQFVTIIRFVVKIKLLFRKSLLATRRSIFCSARS